VSEKHLFPIHQEPERSFLLPELRRPPNHVMWKWQIKWD